MAPKRQRTKNVLEAFSRLRCQDLASRRLRVVCYARALHCRGGRLVRIWPLTGEWAELDPAAASSRGFEAGAVECGIFAVLLVQDLSVLGVACGVLCARASRGAE